MRFPRFRFLLSLVFSCCCSASTSFADLNCGSCDCMSGWKVKTSTCDSSCGGSCTCEYIGDESDTEITCKAILGIFTCFITTIGEAVAGGDGSCISGDGSCKSQSDCNYSCGEGAAAACIEGHCVCALTKGQIFGM